MQRNILLLGQDVIAFISEIALPYIDTVDFDRLEPFLSLLNYSVTLLKSQSLPLIDYLFLELFRRMALVPIPTTDTSDLDKNNLRVFTAFFKLVSTCVEVDAGFLVSDKNKAYFQEFLRCLQAHFDQNADRLIKKTVVYILKDMLLDFTGLKLNPALISQFSRRLPDTPP